MSASANLSHGPNWHPEVLEQIEAEARVASQEQGQGSYEHLSLNSGGVGSTGIVEQRPGKHGRKAMRRFLFVFDLCLVWGSAGVAMLFSAHLRFATSETRELVFPPGSAGFLLF